VVVVWREAEDEVMRGGVAACESTKEIMEHLPGRTWKPVQGRGNRRLGLKRRGAHASPEESEG
jgi:hypothetical protein